MAQERQASFFAGAAARLQYRVSMGEVSRSDATEDNGKVRLPAFEPVAVPELLIEHGAVDAESGDDMDDVDDVDDMGGLDVGACLADLGLTDDAAADAEDAMRSEQDAELAALQELPPTSGRVSSKLRV